MFRVLEYQSDLFSKLPKAVILIINISPVIVHSAACGTHQAVQMLDQRGFARAGVPDQPDKISVLKHKADILKRLLFISGARAVYIVYLIQDN